FPLGLVSGDFRRLLPKVISKSLALGLNNFSSKIRGYDQGLMLGLESKTSSPIRAERDKVGKCDGFANLYLCGEGSGYAGGIVSSGADGLKAAGDILSKE
ncbi:MAG: FAD-dependent oxidoreductase, partial [Chlorobi bacterium]|nr:FAD-dependent oxidoreductase [Chlorobiota bacterium]